MGWLRAEDITEGAEIVAAPIVAIGVTAACRILAGVVVVEPLQLGGVLGRVARRAEYAAGFGALGGGYVVALGRGVRVLDSGCHDILHFSPDLGAVHKIVKIWIILGGGINHPARQRLRVLPFQSSHKYALQLAVR